MNIKSKFIDSELSSIKISIEQEISDSIRDFLTAINYHIQSISNIHLFIQDIDELFYQKVLRLKLDYTLNKINDNDNIVKQHILFLQFVIFINEYFNRLFYLNVTTLEYQFEIN